MKKCISLHSDSDYAPEKNFFDKRKWQIHDVMLQYWKIFNFCVLAAQLMLFNNGKRYGRTVYINN